MTRRSHARQTHAALLLPVLAICFLCGRSEAADEIDLARRALAARQLDKAQSLLIEVIEADDVTPTKLQAASTLALVMADKNLLERVRAVGERLEEDDAGGENATSALDLALGAAYLGLAEDNLRTQTGGSSTALLFADAEDRAAAVLKAGSHPVAHWISARTRYAMGDRPGALKRLEGLEADALDQHGQLALGNYLYERGAGRAVGADGRPTEAALADLRRAAALIGRVLDADSTPGQHPDRLERAMLTRAWSFHRMGSFPEARGAYLEAHEAGGKTARFARRGLTTLFARDRVAQIFALETAAAGRPDDPAPLDDLIALHVKQKDHGGALRVLQRRLAAHPKDAAGYEIGGRLFAGLSQWHEAAKHYTKALELDAGYDLASYGLQRVANALAESDHRRAFDVYETALRLRPTDPFVRNNYGFLLREWVFPFTTMRAGNLQTLKPDAPPAAREALLRCRDVYAEAVALIPASEDESRELKDAWNVAGIVNDYGLMLHYFVDIQDAPKAEALYLRALRMTEDSFKDSYHPNLRRLYQHVLTGRELTWYRVARRAKDAILREQGRQAGMVLVPDEAKRKTAAADERRLRAQIVLELREDAAEDDAPWPIKANEGSGR